jgi:tight adherence protein C
VILLGTTLIFASIVALVMALSERAQNPMSARLAGIRATRQEEVFARLRGERQAEEEPRSLGASLGHAVAKVLPGKWVKGIEVQLIRAGQPVTLAGFLGMSAVAVITMALFAVTIATSGSLAGPLTILLLVLTIALGFAMPKVYLDNRVRLRQKQIQLSLPDSFDLITTCVEAGLGLEAALARVAEKIGGPFGEEITIMLHEVAMGRLRRDAMKDIAERTDVPDLTAFINAVIQAESMGTSIAAVLRVQAEQMRIKRRQRAEQQAHAAPIKMMFPLVLFIFPTLFIVILGPAGISIYEQLIARE